MTAERVLEELRAGNARFCRRRARTRTRTPAETAAQQRPRCVVLSCSDSRVPPEVVFDQDLGDLFVVRVAGHVVSEAVLASVELAVALFEPPVLLVMGHTSCGALMAACNHAEDAQALPSESVRRLVDSLLPSVRATEQGDPATRVDRAVAQNVAHAAEELRASPVIQDRAERGRLTIVEGIYDLQTGRVELSAHPRARDSRPDRDPAGPS